MKQEKDQETTNRKCMFCGRKLQVEAMPDGLGMSYYCPHCVKEVE